MPSLGARYHSGHTVALDNPAARLQSSLALPPRVSPVYFPQEESMILTMIGAVIVVFGVFLPWTSGTVSGVFNGGSGTASGIKSTEGIISIGLAILNGVFGLLGKGKVIPNRVVGFLIILASAAILGVVLNTIRGLGRSDIGVGTMRVTATVSPEPGLFITAGGAVLLLVGGIILAARSTR
jgi:hypothetical protein